MLFLSLKILNKLQKEVMNKQKFFNRYKKKCKSLFNQKILIKKLIMKMIKKKK